MGEHMRRNLIRLEFRTVNRVECKKLCELILTVQHQLRYKYQRVDDDEIFDDGWKGLGSRVFEGHPAKLLYRAG